MCVKIYTSINFSVDVDYNSKVLQLVFMVLVEQGFVIEHANYLEILFSFQNIKQKKNLTYLTIVNPTVSVGTFCCRLDRLTKYLRTSGRTSTWNWRISKCITCPATLLGIGTNSVSASLTKVWSYEIKELNLITPEVI